LARGRLAAALELLAGLAGDVLAGLRTGSPIEQHLTGHPCENGGWGIPWAMPRGPIADCLLPYQTVRPQQPRGGARRFSKEELQELCRQLEPAYRAGFRLQVRCGHCSGRRLLDEIVITHEVQRDVYSLTTNLPSSTRPGSESVFGQHMVTDANGNPIRGGITRPSVTRAKGAFGRPESRPEGHDAWVYECHRRCGATHAFNEGRLLQFFLRAFAEGRTELIAGVDRL
jgi:hypothetical protein